MITVKLCKKRKYSKLKTAKVDDELGPLVQYLNDKGIETVGCCCGHGRYPATVLIKEKGKIIDIFSQEEVPRVKRFYFKNKKQGLYYIPEVSKNEETQQEGKATQN